MLIFASNVVAYILSTGFVLVSNATQQTPFPTFFFHNCFPALKSKRDTSPLSYPEAKLRSLAETFPPKATLQQSTLTDVLIVTTGFATRGSKTHTLKEKAHCDLAQQKRRRGQRNIHL